MAKDNSRGHGNASNGPYSWGNGPKPQGGCSCKRAAELVGRGKVQAARRTFVYGWKARLGVI